MENRREKVIEIDRLFQQIAKESSCWFNSFLPDNITPAQYFILKIISDNDKCKAADIAHILDISPAATTHLVDRLSKNGWLERIRSNEDRRIVWLELTCQGSNLLKDIESRRYDLILKKLDDISEQELSLLAKMLQKLLTN